ncbi:MAG: trans-2-enoyl-CoA reductase family protein [Gammaproteobacteria bacterium]|nr:trans-2-enoyl-CoA reductase family protein [Gammaproteobacteria bacterium]
MIVGPRIRGFICTTAHPTGCAALVKRDFERAEPLEGGPRNVLVLGASGGYGLASRITAAAGCGAATLGVSFEKAPAGKRTGSAGWYNTRAFDAIAAGRGLKSHSIDGDAFSDEIKSEVCDALADQFGPIDLLVYSLASPVRQHPRTGELHRSAIKPLGAPIDSRTLDIHTGEVTETHLEPATDEETQNTVVVMGGEDWEFWIDALAARNLLSERFQTVAYTYLGSELTWPIYHKGTLGRAKEDLDRAAEAIRGRLQGEQDARVAALMATVTQASTAIPVVPLYVSILFKVLKTQGVFESTIEHIERLFRTALYGSGDRELDDAGRLRLDGIELGSEIQSEVARRWAEACTENIDDLSDLESVRAEFLRVFGFAVDGVDYEAEQDIFDVPRM